MALLLVAQDMNRVDDSIGSEVYNLQNSTALLLVAQDMNRIDDSIGVHILSD
jgi:hypothetical protein